MVLSTRRSVSLLIYFRVFIFVITNEVMLIQYCIGSCVKVGETNETMLIQYCIGSCVKAGADPSWRLLMSLKNGPDWYDLIELFRIKDKKRHSFLQIWTQERRIIYLAWGNAMISTVLSRNSFLIIDPSMLDCGSRFYYYIICDNSESLTK